MKFYILKKPYWSFSLFTAKLSPYKIQLETGYLIKNFVMIGILITNMLEVSKLEI